jgi:hypothetical protein
MVHDYKHLSHHSSRLPEYGQGDHMNSMFVACRVLYCSVERPRHKSTQNALLWYPLNEEEGETQVEYEAPLSCGIHRKKKVHQSLETYIKKNHRARVYVLSSYVCLLTPMLL